MTFRIAPATTADIPALTAMLMGDGPSPFMQMMLGDADQKALNFRHSSRIGELLDRADEAWMVARDEATGMTASYAQWGLPADEHEADADLTPDEAEAEREKYKGLLTAGMNVPLALEFKEQIEEMRKKILRGKKYYLLKNLGTAKTWQRKGAASMLVRWPFDEADRQGLVIYLDTASDGPGITLYEKLGFQKVGECHIDLTEYGHEGSHTHIAMIRYPKSS